MEAENTTLSDRLKTAYEAAKERDPTITKSGLARYCGIKQPSVADWFSGKSKSISDRNAIRAAEYLGVNVQWLVGRDVAMLSQSIEVIHHPEQKSDDLIEISEYEVRFGAGSEPEPTYSEITESVKAYYRPEWFIHRHINPHNCKRFKVHGCSMEPLIWDGDTILVDCSPQKILEGRVYAFGVGGELRVKILYPMLDGSIVVKSANPDVRDEVIHPYELDSFVLIGRVRDRSGGDMF